MSGPIRGILFDKDGTLLDFQASWGSWAVDLVDHLTRQCPDQRARLLKHLDVDAEARLVGSNSVIVAGTPVDIVQTLTSFFPDREQNDLIDEIVALSANVRPVPVGGLRDTLVRLRAAGTRLGVATNDAEGIARRQLDELGIADLFDYVVGFDSGHGSKPGPGMCIGFAKAVDVAPEACVMVGDSLHDLKAGRSAGMTTVAVLTGVAKRDELAPFADHVFPDVTGLVDWVRA